MISYSQNTANYSDSDVLNIREVCESMYTRWLTHGSNEKLKSMYRCQYIEKTIRKFTVCMDMEKSRSWINRF